MKTKNNVGKVRSCSSIKRVMSSQAPKGTKDNPFTVEEFLQLCDDGLWTGGYVEGLGYVQERYGVVVEGLSNETCIYNEMIISYELYENVGFLASFVPYVTSTRDGANLIVNALYQQAFSQYNFSANAIVSVDGTEDDIIQLAYTGPEAHSSNYEYIGSATINLNNYNGHVKVVVTIVGELENSSSGQSLISCSVTVYEKDRD